MFFEMLKKICVENGTTPTAVTQLLGYSTGSISHWKKGNYPSGDIVLRFAKHFGVSTDYFLSGEDSIPLDHSNDTLTDALIREGITDTEKIRMIRELVDFMKNSEMNAEVATDFFKDA